MAAVEPVRLPPWPQARQWARTAWANAKAKEVWEPRVHKINKALEQIEIQSVYEEVRPSALLFKTPEELVALTQEALRHGCVAFVLNLEGSTGANYSASASAYAPGKPFRFRTILTQYSAPWVAHQHNDELAIGELLGYPKCCSEFYKRVWVDEAWRDTTYEMARGGTEGPVEANILLRWSGVRFVRHLPCSFSCKPTQFIGVQTEELGQSLGFAEEMGWMREMLSWNVEWSSLHGVAEIKTPVLKISTSTDPFATKVVVRKHGTGYPDEGATGLDFPFEQPTKRKVTESKSFIAAIGSSREWKDNGFSSKEAMVAAHDVLLSALHPLAQEAIGQVLDLGCGNGALLERLGNRFECTLHGVELDPDRWFRGQARIEGGYIRPGNISDVSLWEKRYDLAVFMPGRLSEMSGPESARVVAQLKTIPYVLLYAYGDWLTGKQFADFDVLHGYAKLTEIKGEGVGAMLFARPLEMVYDV